MLSLTYVAPFMLGILGNCLPWKPSIKVLECHSGKDSLELEYIFAGTNSFVI